MLLTSKYVIPVTSSYIEDGGVLVRDDKIEDIGPISYLKDKYPEEEVKDYGLSAIMPGFVDVHTHLSYTALRGMFEDLSYAQWKREVLYREPFFEPEDWENSSRLGALEAVASGITTIADITNGGTARIAAQEIGLRAKIYKEISTIQKAHVGEAVETGLEELERWRKEARGSLVTFGVAPGPLYACHPAVFKELAAYAEQTKTPVALHMGGSQEEADFVRYGSSPFNIHASAIEKKYGKIPAWLPAGTSPVKYVYNWDLLDPEDVLAIHCVHVDDEDIDILAERDIAVAYCPRINAKLGMGSAPVLKFLDKGMRVGFGTDSPAAVDTTDMIDEMRFGLLISRATNTLKGKLLKSDHALRMATIDAARALKLDDQIGSLEIGKKADIIVVDLHNSHQNPTSNPPAAVIYTANQDNVSMTMVNGKILYENFVHLSGLDRDGIIENARAVRRRIREGLGHKGMREDLVSKMSEDERDRMNRIGN